MKTEQERKDFKKYFSNVRFGIKSYEEKNVLGNINYMV